MADGMDLLKPLVLDLGSRSIKVGFAGDDAPFSVFESIIGQPRHTGCLVGLKIDTKVGDEALCRRGVLMLKRPIQCGIINNWDDMEKVLHHMYCNELFVSPESHPALLTEPPFNPKTNREKTTEVMFETFHVPAMYVALQSVLSLYATGHTTGLVIESGKEVSYTIPIYEGHVLPHAISKLDFGGRDLSSCLYGDLTNSFCHNLPLELDVGQVEDVKKAIGYVALDFDEELELATNNPASVDMVYESRDDESLTLCSQRFRWPEALSQPSLVRMGTSGIHEKAHDSIMKCDEDMRKSMYSRVVLSGGSTLFPGFANRISKELSVLAPNDMKVKVIAPEKRTLSPWIGGSILASLDTFRKVGFTAFFATICLENSSRDDKSGASCLMVTGFVIGR